MTPHLLATADLWTRYTNFAPWAWAGFALLILLLVGAIGWVIYRRLSQSLGGRRDAEMMILKGLESGGSMTAEERKKVSAALARQYMRPTEKPSKKAAGMSPLQQLAMEAQRLEEDARRAAAQKKPPTAPIPESPPEEPLHVEQSAPAPVDESANLPPMMRKLLEKSDIELEDMVAADLISEEDLQWVRRSRGRQE